MAMKTETVEEAIARGVNVQKIARGVSGESWRYSMANNVQRGKQGEGIYRRPEGDFIASLWVKDRIKFLGIHDTLEGARKARRDEVLRLNRERKERG